VPAGIVGLILGIVALVKIKRKPAVYRGRGMAIAGICTGGASLAIVPLMISIMLPALSRARELSKRTVCAANMRGIGQALLIYAQDDGMFPEKGADWQARLVNAGIVMPTQFLCPSDTRVSGSLFYYVPGYGDDSDPAQIILYEDPTIHGGEGGNILYQDGHVAFVKSPQYEKEINAITLPDGTPWAPHKGR
jgi:prepilin-type processing-associated H-X9-DG protein